MWFVTRTSASIDLTQSLLVSNTALCSEVVRWKAPMHILWWSNLYNSLNHKFVLSRMCMVTTCVKKNRVYSVVKFANYYCPQDVPWCDKLTAKRCSQQIWCGKHMVTLYCCMVINSPIRLLSWSVADGGIEIVSSWMVKCSSVDMFGTKPSKV